MLFLSKEFIKRIKNRKIKLKICIVKKISIQKHDVKKFVEVIKLMRNVLRFFSLSELDRNIFLIYFYVEINII